MREFADDGIARAFPIEWTVGTRLARHRTVLPLRPPPWPLCGPALLHLNRVEVAPGDESWRRADLAVLEVERASELSEISLYSLTRSLPVLALVGPELALEAARHRGTGHDETFRAVVCGAGEAGEVEARRAVALFLRRALAQVASRRVQKVRLGLLGALSEEGLGFCAPALPAPRALAPWRVLEQMHVQGVLGFYLDRGRGQQLLEVRWGRLQRLLGARPPLGERLQSWESRPGVRVALGECPFREAMLVQLRALAGLLSERLEILPPGSAAADLLLRPVGEGWELLLSLPEGAGGAPVLGRVPREPDASGSELLSKALRQAGLLRRAGLCSELAGLCAEELSEEPPWVGEQGRGLDGIFEQAIEQALQLSAGQLRRAAALLDIPIRRLERRGGARGGRGAEMRRD